MFSKVRMILAPSILLGIFIFSESQAGTRTVSFSSVARAVTLNEVSGVLENDCVITVLNLSNVTQRVSSINFLTGAPIDGDTFIMPATPTSSRIISASDPVDGCVGLPLPAGAMCVMRFRLYGISIAGGGLGICAGKLTVSDVSTGGVSGSVIASGTVQMTQEVQVMGGVLSGAYYASNPVTPEGYTDYSAGLTGVPSTLAHNMNIGCTPACMATKGAVSTYESGKWSKARCMAHCGAVLTKMTGGGHLNGYTRYWNWGVLVPPKLNYSSMTAEELARMVGPAPVGIAAGTGYSQLTVSGVLKNLGGTVGYRTTGDVPRLVEVRS